MPPTAAAASTASVTLAAAFALTRSLILNNETGRDEERDSRQDMIGQTGTTLTDITPSGHAIIEGKKIDVMTEGRSIPKGSDVEITATRGPSIIVRKIEA